MLISSDQIKSQFSSNLQKLMEDVLAHSDGSRPLVFCDEEEFHKVTGNPLQQNDVACLLPSDQMCRICLRHLDSITTEVELAIAHELGHLWLQFHRFPRKKMFTDAIKQEAYRYCFGPLLDIMEHAVYYPWLRDNYNFDLYKVGNQRLVDFIKNEIPKRTIVSQADEISLMLNYIKFHVESNNLYWQEKLRKAYSKPVFLSLKEIAERPLPVIMELSADPINPHTFIETYRNVLELMDIERSIWPSFLTKGP